MVGLRRELALRAVINNIGGWVKGGPPVFQVNIQSG